MATVSATGRLNDIVEDKCFNGLSADRGIPHGRFSKVSDVSAFTYSNGPDTCTNTWLNFFEPLEPPNNS